MYDRGIDFLKNKSEKIGKFKTDDFNELEKLNVFYPKTNDYAKCLSDLKKTENTYQINDLSYRKMSDGINDAKKNQQEN